MKKLFADFVRETTTTTGTGDVTLAAATGYPRFNDRFATNDQMYYQIRDGLNWEKGYGTYLGSNVLSRVTIFGTLVAGIWTEGGSPLTLSGAAAVWCSPTEDFIKNLHKIEPVILLVSAVANIYPGFSYHLEGDGCDLTPPSSPTAGDRIELISAGAASGTVRANGQKFGGVVGDMTINIAKFKFDLTYKDAAFGWMVHG